ncbi:MAG: hypothetical protein DRJ31_06970 [Candidatus Methanomethylicota archaeon]|uniref:NADH:ubiquinone oxidoreductase 30kDa subunit domain-containing protein n=1 Tax=Thermoproteota archaeon TaxID=2056631 RepID=A0A497EMC4_9CREN|nr:MAG: hypothetical protein DRJ31_06970 [Candidatus Verstraetearchaeota archaeon]
MSIADEIREKLRETLKDDYLDEKSDEYNRFYIRTHPNRIRETVKLLVDEFDGRLISISANDLGFEGFDLVYHFDFSHKEKSLHIAIKVRIPRSNPSIDSVADIAWSANWAERELMDLMGIKFVGHPDPRRLFLPYAWPSEEVA